MKQKRFRSLKIVLITTLITVIIAGGGVAGFLYWKENFTKPKEEVVVKAEEKEEDKIKGKNIVIVTSNNEKLSLSFLNVEDKKIIKKEIELGMTLRDGKWEDPGKNPLVQFSKDGREFVFAEIKESNLSDKQEYFKLIKSDFDKKEKETLVESPSYSGIGNFIYTDKNIFYLKSQNQNTGDEESSEKTESSTKNVKTKQTQEVDQSPKWDLISLDLKTKTEEVLLQDAGKYFQSKLEYKDGKILGLYKENSKFFEASIDPESKRLEKNFLFSYKKTREYDLEVSSIFPSLGRTQFLYKDYNAKEGNSLKLYDLRSKKISTLIKNQNSSPDKVFWLSESEITFVKEPSNGVSSEEPAKYEIVKIDTFVSNAEESSVSSSDILTPLLFIDDVIVYLENSKIMYQDGSDRKDFEMEELKQSPDIFYVGYFDY